MAAEIVIDVHKLAAFCFSQSIVYRYLVTYEHVPKNVDVQYRLLSDWYSVTNLRALKQTTDRNKT